MSSSRWWQLHGWLISSLQVCARNPCNSRHARALCAKHFGLPQVHHSHWPRRHPAGAKPGWGHCEGRRDSSGAGWEAGSCREANHRWHKNLIAAMIALQTLDMVGDQAEFDIPIYAWPVRRDAGSKILPVCADSWLWYWSSLQNAFIQPTEMGLHIARIQGNCKFLHGYNIGKSRMDGSWSDWVSTGQPPALVYCGESPALTKSLLCLQHCGLSLIPSNLETQPCGLERQSIRVCHILLQHCWAFLRPFAWNALR